MAPWAKCGNHAYIRYESLLRQDQIVWRYKTDSSLKMAENECIENLKKYYCNQ